MTVTAHVLSMYGQDLARFAGVVEDFLVNVNAVFPKIYNKAVKRVYPDNDFMDQYYRTWIQRKKKAGKIKKRYLCKVGEPKLTSLHSGIANLFPLNSSTRVYSYKKTFKCSDCAAEHVGAFALYKLDISDFFYSITREMIQELYLDEFNSVLDRMPVKGGVMKCSSGSKFSCDEAKIRSMVIDLSYALAILVTRSDPRKKNKTDAVLPIGTIPASNISNKILMGTDVQLASMSTKADIIYTRYSDNMFFSKMKDHISRDFQKKAKEVVEDFEMGGIKPFKINEDKTSYSARWRQQRILGIVINEKLNISKGKEKYLRSALNHLYYDFQQLYDAVDGQTTDLKTLQKSYAQFFRRSDRIFGQMAHIYQVAPMKYLKYATWQHSIKLLRDEIGLMINEIAAGKSKKAKSGGAS